MPEKQLKIIQNKIQKKSFNFIHMTSYSDTVTRIK